MSIALFLWSLWLKCYPYPLNRKFRQKRGNTINVTLNVCGEVFLIINDMNKINLYQKPNSLYLWGDFMASGMFFGENSHFRIRIDI